ncbi:MAG TPA: phosphoribosyl-AMP cyclohydrolase [Methanoculleus sp.]|nr:phosphoribosyl-AMP cyclohydrolase [Methanoculleus sp.]
MPLNFTNGLIPVVAQDIATKDILMVAYANAEAVELTIATGHAHYFSRSRQKLWRKGEESGHTQRVVRILTDCDEDTLIYQVEQQGAACHTGYKSCFYRTIDGEIIAEKVFEPEQVYSTTVQ